MTKARTPMTSSRHTNPDRATPLQRMLRYPLLLGALFSSILFVTVVQLSVNERERDFLMAAQGAGIDFREHLDEGERVLDNIVLLFNASSHVSAKEFQLFIDAQFSSHEDIRSVYFLARATGENRYARGAIDQPLAVSVATGNGEIPLHSLYHSERPENHFPGLGWEVWNESNMVQATARAITDGGVQMGGMIALDDGTTAFSQYKAVYASGSGERPGELLGVVAILFRPADVLPHIADDYQVNLSLRIGERAAGASLCCQESSDWPLPLPAWEEEFEFRGMPMQLQLSRGLSWDDIHMKVAVMAFVLGALLSLMVHRLRVANMEHTQLLLERNRTIRRKVEEQTRAVRKANAELAQEKAALDEHAIVSIADTSGNITYVNEKFCEISGYASDELVGHNHRIVKSDRHTPEFYDEMWQTISQGKVWHGVVCNRAKGGDEYWVNSTIVPFLNERGLPYQYVSIRTDVTHIVNVEAALAKREQELNSIIDMVPALIWHMDCDSRIVRANGSSAQLVESEPAAMVGLSHTDFFPPEDAARYRADDLKVIESGEPLLDVRESVQVAEGMRHFRVDRVPHRDENGEIIGLILVASDITRQEEAEQGRLRSE